MTRTAPSALRFLALVQRPPASIAIVASALVGFGVYLAVVDPADLDQVIGITLFLQMFAASTGYRDRLRRGHFDPILIVSRGRLRIACAHFAISAVPGFATWLALAAIDVGARPHHWPTALSPGGLVAIVFVSAAAWTMTLPLPRLTGGAVWVIALFVLGASGRLARLTEIFKQGGSSWDAAAKQAGAALVCPFLPITGTTAIDSRALAIAIAACLAMWALGWLIIMRCEGTLAESS